jgi:hypothetical protein
MQLPVLDPVLDKDWLLMEGCKCLSNAGNMPDDHPVYDWSHCAMCSLLCTPRCPIEGADVIARLMARLPSAGRLYEAVPKNTEIITEITEET